MSGEAQATDGVATLKDATALSVRAKTITAAQYRPLRALLFWSLLAAAAIWLLFAFVGEGARGATTVGAGAFAGFSEPTSVLTGIWLRSIANPYCQLMLVGGATVLAYGLAQAQALRLEVASRLYHCPRPGAPRRPALLLLAVTGRPAERFGTLATDPVHLEVGIELLFYPLRQAQTLFPAVGFIGTVIGISGAIRSLPEVIQNQSVDDLIASLHVAFDTTFIGLVVAAAVGVLLVVLDIAHAKLRALADPPACNAADG